MFSRITKATAALGIMGAVYFAIGAESLAGPDVATFASVGGETSVPYGWVDFCQRYRGECQDDERIPQDIDLTRAALRKIERVNAVVNKSVAPVSDQDHWGIVDQWDYASDGKGDCEEYALLKRRLLIEEGFPREALLVTVVKEKNGDGHAILTIKTNRGEYVLDNLTDSLRPWASAPYRFVKRQSQQNQNVWVAIGAPTSEPRYVSR
jgi:predicted transglutaminase-like cysteine proteinase